MNNNNRENNGRHKLLLEYINTILRLCTHLYSPNKDKKKRIRGYFYQLCWPLLADSSTIHSRIAYIPPSLIRGYYLFCEDKGRAVTPPTNESGGKKNNPKADSLIADFEALKQVLDRKKNQAQQTKAEKEAEKEAIASLAKSLNQAEENNENLLMRSTLLYVQAAIQGLPESNNAESREEKQWLEVVSPGVADDIFIQSLNNFTEKGMEVSWEKLPAVDWDFACAAVYRKRKGGVKEAEEASAEAQPLKKILESVFTHALQAIEKSNNIHAFERLLKAVTKKWNCERHLSRYASWIAPPNMGFSSSDDFHEFQVWALKKAYDQFRLPVSANKNNKNSRNLSLWRSIFNESLDCFFIDRRSDNSVNIDLYPGEEDQKVIDSNEHPGVQLLFGNLKGNKKASYEQYLNRKAVRFKDIGHLTIAILESNEYISLCDNTKKVVSDALLRMDPKSKPTLQDFKDSLKNVTNQKTPEVTLLLNSLAESNVSQNGTCGSESKGGDCHQRSESMAESKTQKGQDRPEEALQPGQTGRGDEIAMRDVLDRFQVRNARKLASTQNQSEKPRAGTQENNLEEQSPASVQDENLVRKKNLILMCLAQFPTTNPLIKTIFTAVCSVKLNTKSGQSKSLRRCHLWSKKGFSSTALVNRYVSQLFSQRNYLQEINEDSCLTPDDFNLKAKRRNIIDLIDELIKSLESRYPEKKPSLMSDDRHTKGLKKITWLNEIKGKLNDNSPSGQLTDDHLNSYLKLAHRIASTVTQYRVPATRSQLLFCQLAKRYGLSGIVVRPKSSIDRNDALQLQLNSPNPGDYFKTQIEQIEQTAARHTVDI